jgi:hypothetical protein
LNGILTEIPRHWRGEDGTRTPSFLDAKNEQSDLEENSTRAPSASPDALPNMLKEKVGNNGNATDDGEKVPDAEYPTGARLGVIVVALILSIFLISLDMVCGPLFLSCLVRSHFLTVQYFADYRCDRHPQNH